MALSGDYVVVIMDDSGGSPRQFADGEIISVDLGLWYDQHDVTGFGNLVHDVIQGVLRAPVMIRGYLTATPTTGTHPVIHGAYLVGSQVSLQVKVGQNAAPQTGDPMFSGEFVVSGYRPVISTGEAIVFEAQLLPATGTAPMWGTVPA